MLVVSFISLFVACLCFCMFFVAVVFCFHVLLCVALLCFVVVFFFRARFVFYFVVFVSLAFQKSVQWVKFSVHSTRFSSQVFGLRFC